MLESKRETDTWRARETHTQQARPRKQERKSERASKRKNGERKECESAPSGANLWRLIPDAPKNKTSINTRTFPQLLDLKIQESGKYNRPM